jgi:hypothetical protein
MGFTPDGYYSFERLDGGYDGLVRVRDGGISFEQASRGYWIGDQALARHFIDPGTTFLEPIDDAITRQLAARYGVEL